MNVLFIGDVVGEPGRRAVRRTLSSLREREKINVVVANGENSAGGAGITLSTARELFDAGVDIITTGDHLWDQREVAQLLEHEPRFLRPANYPAGVPGRGMTVVSKPGCPDFAVLNLQGRTFMPPLENPFTVAEVLVAELRTRTPLILIDFHAEATSEKIALGWLLDGQVSAIIGTHTHVQTADERILPRGTACLTDAGFTGGHGGVLGREWPPVVEKFQKQTPQRFGVCETDVKLNGCLIQIDDETGHALAIRRVSESVMLV